MSAGLLRAAGAFRDARMSSTAGSNPRTEPHETPDFLSHDTDRWLSIFCREAGPKDTPTLLLLHGLPSSSRMFAPLFARLANRYHLLAPDFAGFGHSNWPDSEQFAYTFDHTAE